jgi:A/G-specific adenine glycosylase
VSPISPEALRTKVTTPSKAQISAFKKTVLKYYHTHGRDLPWRRTDDPYKVLVSEVMLQQTQVSRVLGKWERFVRAFPDFACLAAASLAEVLIEWRGLGYNRRALYLKEIARVVSLRHAGKLPDSPEDLVKLPGIGANTAGAILTFAFNRPTVFIETNIRSVFIHHFFADRTEVKDTQILPLVEATLDMAEPRTWYWALMDYGSMLKEMTENPSRKSAHHVRQSTFKGSDREIRGAILRLFVQADGHRLSVSDIVAALPMEADRIKALLSDLLAEGFIVKEGRRYRIAG